jgi:CRP/FNR family transcriptional regulator, anaerobic regulatory protein
MQNRAPDQKDQGVYTFNPCQACSVRELSVCSALDSTELASLDRIVSRTQVAPRQMISYQGDPAEYLFNVTEGAIKIYKLLADGRRQITGFLFRGDFLGLAVSDRYTYSAEAITSASLCRFPREKLEKLIEQYPKLERRLLQTASNELAAAQDQMLLLGRKTAEERMATFILNLSDRAIRRSGSTGDVVALPMPRNDIGDYLGLTIETVSRSITRLRKLSAISLENSRAVRIVDHDLLLELAGLANEDRPTLAVSL